MTDPTATLPAPSETDVPAADLAGAATPDPKPETAKKTPTRGAAAAKSVAAKDAAKDADAAKTDAPAAEPAKPAPRAPGKRGPSSPLKDADEAKMLAAVTGVVPEGSPFHDQAVRFGRKAAKQVRGLRGSAPSLGGLKKETAEKVTKAVTDALAA